MHPQASEAGGGAAAAAGADVCGTGVFGPLLKFGLGLGRGLYAKALLEKGFVHTGFGGICQYRYVGVPRRFDKGFIKVLEGFDEWFLYWGVKACLRV